MLSFGFRIFCWYRGFCHRTGSDLLLFLFNKLGRQVNHKKRMNSIDSDVRVLISPQQKLPQFRNKKK